jgi:salicylate hydroxylase
MGPHGTATTSGGDRLTGWTGRVAIVGAGIGGLTLALALRERGVTAEVFEQASSLEEIGAAVALSANATRLLADLGVGAALDEVSTEPTELIFRRWSDGRRISAHPVRQDGWYRTTCGAPYYGVHRKELQRILGHAWGEGAVHLGRRLVDLHETADGVRLTWADGSSDTADLVIGADGVRSTVRQWMTGQDDTRFSGTSGFRGIVPVDQLGSLPDPQAIQFWVGPGAHLLHYAIGGDGGHVNFLAVVEGPDRWRRGSVWRDDCTHDEAMAHFAGWHPAVIEMVGAVTHVERWGLFVVQPLRGWSRGSVVLMGDAAHGMLPHQGQGANQTIEDAITLADVLAAGGAAPLAARLDDYERARRRRTQRVQRLSWVTNQILHVPDGPAAGRRDAMLQDVARDILWIHGYDARGAGLSGAAPS